MGTIQRPQLSPQEPNSPKEAKEHAGFSQVQTCLSQGLAKHWPTGIVPHTAVQRAGTQRSHLACFGRPERGPQSYAHKQEGTDCGDLWAPTKWDLEVRAPSCRRGLGPVRQCGLRAHSKKC